MFRFKFQPEDVWIHLPHFHICLPLVSTWRLWSSLSSSLSPVSSLLPDTDLCWFPGSSRLLQPCNVLWEDLCVSATWFLNYSLPSSVSDSPVIFTCNDLGFLSGHCKKQHNFSSTSCWYLLGMRSKKGPQTSGGWHPCSWQVGRLEPDDL